MKLSNVAEAKELSEPEFTVNADSGNLIFGSNLHPWDLM